MNLSQRGLDVIKSFEGFSSKAYLCPSGIWTNGYGHTNGVTKDTPEISVFDAEKNLQSDLAISQNIVDRLIKVPLAQGQYDALVSFTFNLGGGCLQRSTLRQKVNREDHEGAVLEFSKWIYGGGRKLPGLIARRKAEAMLYGRY